jgi:hypothetical protein
MTVNTTNITSGPYIGNGASAEYSYTFRVEDKTQLSVYETDDAGVQTILTVDTDYTVAGIGIDAGGLITRVAGNLPTDYQWYIRSNRVENQLTEFASQGGFFPDVHEAQMDHITFLIQQLRDGMARHFGLSDSIDVDGDFTISDAAADRINKILGFDVDGDLTVVTLNEEFITVYLGAKSSDPTLDNQGNALIDGAMYKNNVSNVVRTYDLGTTSWSTVNPSNAAVDITINDTAGNFDSGEVEGALAECATKDGAQTLDAKTLTELVDVTGTSSAPLNIKAGNNHLFLSGHVGANAVYLGFYQGTGGTVFGDGAGGSNAHVNAAGEFVGKSFNGLNTKVIEIGDWDMDATQAINVAHGLTMTNIRAINVMIRTDDNSLYTNLDYRNATQNGGYFSPNNNGTDITLGRDASGLFDDPNYNATSFNRGWVTIQYVN